LVKSPGRQFLILKPSVQDQVSADIKTEMTLGKIAPGGLEALFPGQFEQTIDARLMQPRQQWILAGLSED
jgi:hypothetical protein